MIVEHLIFRIILRNGKSFRRNTGAGRMNDRQIAFIMCVNDDRQADESEFYIRCLDVPEHYEVDVIRVREAVSMAALPPSMSQIFAATESQVGFCSRE